MCRLPGRGSAVPAAPTAAARRLAAHRGSAVLDVSPSSARPRILRDDLDRARVDQLPERRVLEVVRGYLSALPGAQMQRLPAGQRDAQGLRGLVGDGCHRGSFSTRAYLPTFAGGLAWLWLSCFDFAAAALCAVAVLFCFWPRSFDLGDLSPMGASIRRPTPSARTIAVAPPKGKRSGSAMPAEVSLSHELLDGSHLARLELEVVDAQVLGHVRSRRRSGERRHAGLEREAEDHLRHGPAGPRGD